MADTEPGTGPLPGPRPRRPGLFLGIVAGLVLLWFTRGTLATLLLACLMAAVLQPVVNRLARWVPRSVAAPAVMVGLIAALVALAAAMLPALVTQAADFARQLPGLIERALTASDAVRAGFLQRMPYSLSPGLNGELTQASQALLGFLSSRFAQILSGIPQLLGLLLVPILALFILTDGPGIRLWLLEWAPAARRPSWTRYFDAAARGLDGFVRGQTLVCLWQAVQCGIVFTLLGLPYPVLLALLAGAAEAVPYAGSTVVSALLLLAGLSQGGWHWAAGLGAYVVLNQVINLVVTPRLMSRHAALHPLATLLAIAAGGELGGILGVVLAVPFAAMLKELLDEIRRERGSVRP